VSVPRVTLDGGVELPSVGLGLFGIEDAETQQLVETALELGYRHFDTASFYGNERGVGAGIANAQRSEVFVTTKLWFDDMGYALALAAFEASRGRLGVDYIDLFLIHWPKADLVAETWRAMETLWEQGKVREIGVSNFQPQDLTALLATAQRLPAVNQLELNPFCYRTQLPAVMATSEGGIHVTAYRPLAKAARLNHPKLVEIANRLDRTPAEVMLRWGLDHGFSLVVKSSNATRLAQNLAVTDFLLPAEDRTALDALDEGLLTAKNPLVGG